VRNRGTVGRGDREAEREGDGVDEREANTDIDSVKVVSVHHSSLVELNLREMSFEQTFQLKSRLFSDKTKHHPIIAITLYSHTFTH